MKENKKKKNVNEAEEPSRPRTQRVEVWVPVEHKAPVSTQDFDWPEFSKERDRIKAYSKRFKDQSISEAMLGIKEDEAQLIIPEIPVTPAVGSKFSVLVSKAKGSSTLTFEGYSSKDSIVCRNNLGRYTDLELNKFPLEAKVISYNKVRQTLYIDILQPLFESWVNGILNDKTIQYNVKSPKTVAVHDLRLSNGGFIGKAEVPTISSLLGEPYFVEAFIPGSQIVLNIEHNFEQWNGKTVDTFVAGYTTKPGTVNQMSLICSRKALLNFSGNLTKIEMFNNYCDNNKKWTTFTKSEFVGLVTGVIDTSKKRGVFVELPTFNITGFVNMPTGDLTDYKEGAEVKVHITDFEQMVSYDSITGRQEHLIPYVIENDCLKSCILKPVLKFA